MSEPSSHFAHGEHAVEVIDLHKTFAVGFLRRKVHAVRGIRFEVARGEILGFLGPNGAGKTTTIKMMVGLIAPSRGQVRVLGAPVPDLAAKRRVGFLPESPYFYDYLSGEELLRFTARLFGLSRGEERRRAGELLARVGLSGEASRRALRRYSKGMLQRIGIAQALINDPELVILDEPMSGLDPIGRKEIRDLILGLRDEGKTVFFSSHILADMELICDRVAILIAGQLRDVGPLDRLLDPRLLGTEVVFRPPPGPAFAPPQIAPLVIPLRPAGEATLAALPSGASVDQYLALLHAAGGTVVSVTPRRESLEDLFVRAAQPAGQSGAGAGAATATTAPPAGGPPPAAATRTNTATDADAPLPRSAP